MSADILFHHALHFCIASVAELRDYLLSENLYWPLQSKVFSRQPNKAIMTIGAVLLAMEQARTLALTISQSLELDRVEADLIAQRTSWRSAWENKAQEEFHARLRRWGQYQEDFYRMEENYSPDYCYEVRWRVVLELLITDLNYLTTSDKERLRELDQQLWTILIPGEFIWDSILSSGFPRERYWYLWGNLIA